MGPYIVCLHPCYFFDLIFYTVSLSDSAPPILTSFLFFKYTKQVSSTSRTLQEAQRTFPQLYTWISPLPPSCPCANVIWSIKPCQQPNWNDAFFRNCYPPYPFIFPIALIMLWYITSFCWGFWDIICPRSPVKNQLHEGKDCSLFCSWLHPCCFAR